MTQKINKILYLVRELKVWTRQKNFYQLSLRRTLHRSVILFNSFSSWFVSLLSKNKATTNTKNTQRTQNIFPKLSIAYLLLIVLASCSLGKQYQQPVLELPKQFNNVSYADTSSIADIQWREFFTDATLQALIDKGLTYNHDLLMATKRIEIAQQRLSQSKLLQLPELNLQFTAQYNRPSNNSLNGISIKNFLGSSHVENYSTQLSATWEADIWGKLKSSRRAQFWRRARYRRCGMRRSTNPSDKPNDSSTQRSGLSI